MKIKANSIEEYIANCPKDRQAGLEQLRIMLKQEFPNLIENLQYGMPTYSNDTEVLFAFGNQKNHMSFYVCHYDLLEKFKNILDKYNCGKSCIRFKNVDTKVLSDLKEITLFVSENIEKSTFKGKILKNDF